MKLTELAQGIGATILTSPASCGEIEHVYAGDRISDLLSHARQRALLVSNLSGASLIRLAELMDLSALCLVGAAAPDAKVIAAAGGYGIGIIVSPVAMFETCGRLYQCLQRHGSGA